MKEIVRISLENEMDLILANKRTMKLAELCSLSLTVQTALGTAVSEIARCALSMGRNALFKLGIVILSPNRKQIYAAVCNANPACANTEAISFARKLIAEIKITKNDSSCDVQLNQDLKFSGLITAAKINSFIEYFKMELPLSPYDEIKGKNIQLLEFSNKLKESENQYRDLVDTLPLMMFLITAEGEILYTNQWVKDYFGTSLTSQSAFSWREFVHPDDYVALNRDWDNIFKSRNSFRTQGRLKNKASGAYLWHLISIIPVKNENNAITRWTGFFVDVNAQKLIEETLKGNVELKEAQKKLVGFQKLLEEKISALNVSNRELEQFAYIASHDLQEPLRKIITFSSLLEDKLKDLDADSRVYFKKIVSSSNRMTELINDVLDWSKIAGTKEEFLLVDLNCIIQNIESDFELLIQQKHAVIQIPHLLPVVNGISLQMTQLFSNLLSNALKFCNTAPLIEVSARSLSREDIVHHQNLNQSLAYTEIVVSDNGIGFEQVYAEEIFKIFQRLNGRSEYKGTGIGLAICKKIVENHGGLISAAGTPGKGARFTIIFPN
ncbi:MAG: ATP-binding protein [Cyclobacteriaceae bacterium]